MYIQPGVKLVLISQRSTTYWQGSSQKNEDIISVLINHCNSGDIPVTKEDTNAAIPPVILSFDSMKTLRPRRR